MRTQRAAQCSTFLAAGGPFNAIAADAAAADATRAVSAALSGVCPVAKVANGLQSGKTRTVAAQHEMSRVIACAGGRSGYTAAVAFVEALLAKFISSMSPHMRQLGLKVVSIQGGVCVAQLPYSEDLIGDPATGVLHGGVVTSLLDTAGGAAVLSALGQPLALATLDLRIDYLRPSTPGQAVCAKVECYKQTYNIAFARGVAFETDEADPIASMAATYMLRTQVVRGGGGAEQS